MRRALLFSVLLPCVLGAQAQPTLDECRELARAGIIPKFGSTT